MTRTVIIIALLFTIAGCINRSPDQSAQELTDRQHQDKIERCKKLQKQIKDLEGKPVRQTTAREYYAKECLDRPSDSEYN